MKKSPPTSRAGTETPLISIGPRRSGPLRQHVVLDLAAELELASDAFLLDGDVLMAFDVLRHLVEGAASLPISSLDPTCTRAL